MHWLLFIGFALMWVPLILLLLGAALEGKAKDNAPVGVSTSRDASVETAFFVKPGADRRPEPSRVLEDQTVIRLEDYLRAEHEEAERFVSRPSIASLYRNCGQSL